MAEYDDWAPYYDLVFQGLAGEAEFYVGQACRLPGPVLDIGCGTGRLAIAMAMCGADVTGIDNSAAMLAVCQAKAEAVAPFPGRLALVQGDMAAMPFVNRFGYAAMAYRTLMHLSDMESQRACLQSVFEALRPEGVFIVNTWAARPSLIAPKLSRPGEYVHGGAIPLPDGEGTLVHACAAWYDEGYQRIDEEHVLQELDAEGRPIHVDVVSMRRTWLYPRELIRLIESAGFRLEAVFGDFDCNPFTGDSSEIVCVARKP